MVPLSASSRTWAKLVVPSKASVPDRTVPVMVPVGTLRSAVVTERPSVTSDEVSAVDW